MADARGIAAQGVGRDTRNLALGGFGARFEVFDPVDRRVAVQGAGFSTRLLALQGLDVRLRRVRSVGKNAPARRRTRDNDNDVLLFLLR